MKFAMYILIILIVGFAIFGTSGLVIEEWNNGGICPKIIGIPACYIVLLCFIGGLLAHLVNINWANKLFFASIGIVTLIAISGTVGELTGLTKCPKTAGGTPMCFISLGICLSLLFSKISYVVLSSRKS